MYLRWICILLTCALLVTIGLNQELNIRKITLSELECDEKAYLDWYNKSKIEKDLPSLSWNSDLIRTAEYEAARLAQMGRLELPAFNVHKSYFGFSFKIFGKIGNTTFGFRMCHNNILNIFDYNVYDLDEYCIPLMLDHKQSYAVGHGQAVDHHGHVYNVRLYYSQQKKKLNPSQTLSIRKINLLEHDDNEEAFVKYLNQSRIANGYEPVSLNRHLINLAQKEAERLAQIGRLETPTRLNVDQKYFGSSYKMTAKIGTKFVGFKVCFDSFSSVTNSSKLYFNDDNCNGEAVDESAVDKVGYGSALDSKKNIFKVRIFTLSGKRSRKWRRKHKKN